MNLLCQPVLRIRRRSHALLGLQSTIPENQLLIKLAHPAKPLIGSPCVNEIENLDINQPKHGYHEKQTDYINEDYSTYKNNFLELVDVVDPK